jgi:hypothetical protein
MGSDLCEGTSIEPRKIINDHLQEQYSWKIASTLSRMTHASEMLGSSQNLVRQGGKPMRKECKVLIVDDSPYNLFVLRELISRLDS